MKSEIINKNGSLVYITFPLLEKTGIVNHAFTTKFGGKSKGYFAEMNMSFGRGDDRNAVLQNYEIICSEIGIKTENLVFSKQTHTNNVLVVTEKDRGTGFSKPSFSDIDGLITNKRNVALVTQFADCTPLLFCDPVKKVIASSHSGWRGTVQRIGKVTVEKMVAEFGCNPKDIVAAIGPAISKCCYEVDKSVFDEFSRAEFDTSLYFCEKENGKYMLDLKRTNLDILLSCGLKRENIDVCDICTLCHCDTMFSHRKSGDKRGNMAAIIELK